MSYVSADWYKNFYSVRHEKLYVKNCDAHELKCFKLESLQSSNEEFWFKHFSQNFYVFYAFMAWQSRLEREFPTEISNFSGECNRVRLVSSSHSFYCFRAINLIAVSNLEIILSNDKIALCTRLFVRSL